MTNPVTPNIGLNKIDRTSPSTTYFDLEKYVDQNADAVDRFAGESNEAINALEKRLDTEERREVVLQPGLQIVNAERSAPFKLSGIKGRTLVNLLGRDGGCEDVSPWSDSRSTHALDNVNKTTGVNGFKITTTASSGNAGNIFRRINNIDKTKHYVLLADLKNGNATRIVLQKQNVGIGGSAPFMEVTDNTKFSTVAVKIQPAYFSSDDTIAVLVYGAQGQYGYADAIRLYEISEAEYAALDDMRPEQVAAEYPYVDSVQPVRNPFVIRYGENLLPSLMSAQFTNTTSFAISQYEWYNPTGADAVAGYSYVQFSVTPKTTYTLSADVASNIDHAVYPLDLNVPDPPKKWNSETSFTFNSGNNTSLNYLVRASVSGNPARLRNPMITLGSTPKPFKLREDSILALQTDLHADPLTGTNADEVFEKDGQYFKLAKWKNITLDGAQLYTFQSSKTGFKWINFAITNGPKQNKDNTFHMTKFDGRDVRHIPGSLGVGTLPDQIDYDAVNKLVYTSIFNSESGWGDNYLPTADEIKGYFMGWVMRDLSAGPYNDSTGAAQKTWTPIGYVPPAHWNSTWEHLRKSVPVNEVSPSVNDKTISSYQLVYQLAMPTVEPIVSEGMLTFNEGDNQIEVGTGLVLRERVNPLLYSPNGNYYANNIALRGGLLKNRVSSIVQVYCDGRIDNSAKIENDANANGKKHIRFLPSDFDQTVAYSATYHMLDKSPIVPFIGSYAVSEKAMLQEVTDAVQQSATVVSVLMNKKVDKDQPGWITPTLLNGWSCPNLELPIRYKKQNGIVYIFGRISNGAVGFTTEHSVFILPVGFRPLKTMYPTVNDATSNSRYIAINPGGNVNIEAGGNTDINLDGISFLAEQ
ncbi:hypothetical protein PAEVO_40890 [Paenibacillus sp. GM2FR]|uniref:hypothetical protein n=1 Tax=Paenibacillus sp. GM2FR TaxID=2059268 RepID=UPI000C273655|nr:hypothetical protein [Paenibacillus sp. GM2FR]PJN57355.1 hypothetical protein PAEVO_40890 [Paenibacillus sp. GM2FR]